MLRRVFLRLTPRFLVLRPPVFGFFDDGASSGTKGAADGTKGAADGSRPRFVPRLLVSCVVVIVTSGAAGFVSVIGSTTGFVSAIGSTTGFFGSVLLNMFLELKLSYVVPIGKSLLACCRMISP